MSNNINVKILEALKSCGVSKKKEEKFHEKLDKLMHSTFGHSPTEKKEKMKEDTHIQDYVAAISNSADFRAYANARIQPSNAELDEQLDEQLDDIPNHIKVRLTEERVKRELRRQSHVTEAEGLDEGFADDVLAAAKSVNPNARMRPSNAELEKERIAASEKRKKELAKQPKRPVETLKPKHPLGGYDPKSHRSYSEETEMTLEDFTLDELETFMESEDYDQLDEISKKTLASYVNKAAHSMASSHGDATRMQSDIADIDRFTNRHMDDKYGTRDMLRDKLKAGRKDLEKAQLTTAKRSHGIASATKRLAKEESDVNEAMIRYSDFIDKVYAHRKAGNDVIDHKYDQKKAHYTVVDKDGVGRTVTHTEKGAKIQNHGVMKGYEKDEKAAKVEPVKRGRGRPKGSKSGART